MPVIIDGTLGVNAAAVTTTNWNPTNLSIPGNATIGDASSDTLTVNATPTFTNGVALVSQSVASPAYAALALKTFTASQSAHPVIQTYRAGGTEASPTASSGTLLRQIAYGHNGSAFIEGAQIFAYQESAWSVGSTPAGMQFFTNDGTTNASRLVIGSNGKVGIGTFGYNATSLLEVNGVLTAGGNRSLSYNSEDGISYSTVLRGSTQNGANSILFLSVPNNNQANASGASNSSLITFSGTFPLGDNPNSYQFAQIKVDATAQDWQYTRMTLGTLNSGALRNNLVLHGDKVGVGIAIPTAALHVSKGSAQTDIDSANQTLQLENTATDATGNLAGVRFRQTNGTNSANAFIGMSSTGNVASRANFIIATPNTSGNATERVRIDSSGNITTGKNFNITSNQSAFSTGVNGLQLQPQGRIFIESNADWLMEMSGATSQRIRFYNNAGGQGTTVGSIEVDAATAYYKAGGVNLNNTGIKFPASQNASSDANTLDDYEEGTFTPTIYVEGSSGSVNPTTVYTAGYTKVGRLVHVWAHAYYANVTANGGGVNGAMHFSGLPFGMSKYNTSTNAESPISQVMLAASSSTGMNLYGDLRSYYNQGGSAAGYLYYIAGSTNPSYSYLRVGGGPINNGSALTIMYNFTYYN